MDIPSVEDLKQEWAVISGAPTLFAIAVLLVGGLMYAIFNLIYGHRIKLMEERLQWKNDRISELEREKANKAEVPPRAEVDDKQTIDFQVISKKPQVPVVLEFNPDNGHYFHQEDRPSDVSGVVTERYREYFCTMYNDSDETLRNVSCEVERIITIKNRPNDVEIHPENVHDKLRYDIPPTFPVTIPVSARGREKIWLFSRLKKVLDNEPIRIVKGSKSFGDKKRVRKVFLRVTAENYLPKAFSVDVWVEDGLLRMAWIQSE